MDLNLLKKLTEEACLQIKEMSRLIEEDHGGTSSQTAAPTPILALLFKLEETMGEVEQLSNKPEQTLFLFKEEKADHHKKVEGIADREEMEQQLLIQTTALNAAANGILITDSDGNILWSNPAFRRLTGYGEAETLGKNPRILKSGHHDNLFYQNMWETISAGKVWQGEITNRRKDGSLFIEDQMITPILNDRGQVAYYIAIQQDISQRKQAEQALRDNELFLKTILDYLPIGIAVSDENGNLIEENRANKRQSSKTRAHGKERFKTYKGWWAESGKLVQPDEWPVIRAIQAGETTLNKVLEIEIDSGKHKFINHSAIPFHTIQHKLGGVISVNQDVTDERLVQNELIKTKEMLEVVFSELALGIAYLDKDFNILQVNKAFNLTDAADPQLYIGKNILEFFSDENERQSFQEVVKTGEPFHAINYTFSHSPAAVSEKIYWDLSLQPIKDEHGIVHGLILNALNVTKRKMNQDQTDKNSKRVEVLAEVSRSLVEARPYLPAVLENFNQTVARLTGDAVSIQLLTPDGKWLEQAANFHLDTENLSAPGSLNTVTAIGGLNHQSLENAEPVFITDLAQLSDLDPIELAELADLQPLKVTGLIKIPLWVNNKSIGWLLLTRHDSDDPYTKEDLDLAESLADRLALAITNANLYQELETALNQEQDTRAQLIQAEKFATIGRMVASVTHEINNPLQTIRNCLFLAQNEFAPDSDQMEYIKMARAETRRLSDLVAQLREIYKPSTLGEKQDFDFLTIVEEVHKILIPILDSHNVIWQQVSTVERGHVECVPDQIKQVLINICNNGIEAMQLDGGILSVQIHEDAEENWIRVLIGDSGPGIAPENLEKIYEPFFTTKAHGLGLGLSICYEIIQRHGGSIDVHNVPSRGAEFVIWLPMSQKANEEPGFG